MRILILANNDVGLYNFRLELIEAMLQKGYAVHISAPYGERIEDLLRLGIIFHESGLERHGINPLKEIRLLDSYKKLTAQIQPDAILGFTIKPNIYGAIAAKKRHIPFIANITGLGTALEGGGWKQRILTSLYRYAFTDVQTVFFQNTENQNFFKEKGIAVQKQKLLPGSGVNLEQNCYEEYPPDDGLQTLLFVGRLMKDKGIEELIHAAERIRKKYAGVRFAAIGFCEPDYRKELQKLDAERFVTLLGEQKNVHEWMTKAMAIIHPSYHEGMSNVLLEAAASGRPVLASNIPGCRETFDEGISGMGFLPRNVESLCETIERFINLPYEVKREMGRAGRRKMEREFDRQIVVNKYMDLIKHLEEEQDNAV